MLSGSPRYLYLSCQRTIACIVLLLLFASQAQAQNKLNPATDLPNHLSPLLVSSFKHPPRPISNLNEHFKRPTNQLMSWPNFPLTYAEIEARDREWERRYNRPFVEQVASDIIKSYVNTLIYGKPYTPAKLPRF